MIRRDYAALNGRQIHFRSAGSQALPTLLCLHQSPSSSVMYEPLMTALGDRFHLLAPDLPGFGGSDRLEKDATDIVTADYAAAVHDFLFALGVNRCFVFGHHMGAGVAVQLEHDFPGTASAMVLSGPTLLTAEQQQALPGRASPIPIRSDGSHLQSMWERIAAKDPDASPQLVQREMQSAFSCGESYLASYTAISQQAYAEQLPTIHCPTLVYAGDHDPLYSAVEPTLALLPRGEGATLQGGERTYVCERQIDQVAPLLREFFSRPEHLQANEVANGS